jgi:hypothetical protein
MERVIDVFNLAAMPALMLGLAWALRRRRRLKSQGK